MYILEHKINQWSKKWNQISRTYHTLRLSSTTHLPKGQLYSSLAKPVRQEIDSWSHPIVRSYDMTVGQIHYTIHLVLSRTEDGWFAEAAKQIWIWFHFIGTFVPHRTKARHITLYLYATDLEKKLPKRGQVLDVIHVNTAFTTFGQPDAEIVLFRREEWFKTLIHESFHTLQLDFATASREVLNQSQHAIREGFASPPELLLFETYCEMWAEILFWMTKSASTPNPWTTWQQFYDTGRTFASYQCNKVLRHMGADYENIVKGTCARKVWSHYPEKTNVFAYYVFKAIAMFHVEEYVEWCEGHHEPESVFAIRLDVATIRAYSQFFVARECSEAWVQHLEQVDSQRVPSSWKQTLRMVPK